MYLSVVLVGILAAVATVNSYPAGNPFCETNFPIHGAKPQTSPSPYEIVVEKTNLKGGETTKVTIKGKNGEKFRGFILTAKSGENRVGKFSSVDDQTSITDCGPGGNAATMSNALDKDKVVVEWTAPTGLTGPVTFHYMMVKVFDIIWIGQKSEDITIS